MSDDARVKDFIGQWKTFKSVFSANKNLIDKVENAIVHSPDSAKIYLNDFQKELEGRGAGSKVYNVTIANLIATVTSLSDQERIDFSNSLTEKRSPAEILIKETMQEIEEEEKEEGEKKKKKKIADEKPHGPGEKPIVKRVNKAIKNEVIGRHSNGRTNDEYRELKGFSEKEIFDKWYKEQTALGKTPTEQETEEYKKGTEFKKNVQELADRAYTKNHHDEIQSLVEMEKTRVYEVHSFDPAANELKKALKEAGELGGEDGDKLKRQYLEDFHNEFTHKSIAYSEDIPELGEYLSEAPRAQMVVPPSTSPGGETSGYSGGSSSGDYGGMAPISQPEQQYNDNNSQNSSPRQSSQSSSNSNNLRSHYNQAKNLLNKKGAGKAEEKALAKAGQKIAMQIGSKLAPMLMGNPYVLIAIGIILILLLIFFLLTGVFDDQTGQNLVSITKSVDKEAVANPPTDASYVTALPSPQDITYTLNVSYSGQAQSITVNDPIPENAVFVSADNNAVLKDENGNIVTDPALVRRVEWPISVGGGTGTNSPPSGSAGREIGVNGNTPLKGLWAGTAQELADYLLSNNSNPKFTVSTLQIAEYYVKYASEVNLRADILWAQMILETGYGESNKVPNNNFAGIGVTGPEVEGKKFLTAESGVKGHVAHLVSYVFTGEPTSWTNASTDPRYNDVNPRGTAVVLNDLNGRWAVPGTTYGADIEKIVKSINKGAPTTQSSQISTQATVSTNSNCTDLGQWLSKKLSEKPDAKGLSEMGTTLANLSAKYNVPYELALGQFWLEARWYSDGGVTVSQGSNNPGNILCPDLRLGAINNNVVDKIGNHYCAFSSLPAGIEAYFTLLNSNYRDLVDVFITTGDPQLVIHKYYSSANDPSGNSESGYVKTVNTVVKDLRSAASADNVCANSYSGRISSAGTNTFSFKIVLKPKPTTKDAYIVNQAFAEGITSGGDNTSICSNGNTIVIDPGHGGPSSKLDPETNILDHNTFNDPETKNVFDVAMLLKSKLEKAGYKAIMTKNNVSDAVTHRQRAEVANSNSAAMAVSIHYDPGWGKFGKKGQVWSQEVGLYREAESGKRVEFTNQAIANKSLEYTNNIIAARKLLENGTTTTGRFSSYGDLAPGNITLDQLFSKVPWVYNEAGAVTTSEEKEAYAQGIYNGIIKSIPIGSSTSQCPGTSNGP